MTSRRDVTATVGSVLVAFTGCLRRISPDRNATEEFSIDDLSVHNDRSDAVAVTVSVMQDSESVLEAAFGLDPDETKVYEDVMANGTEYDVTVAADGMSETVSFDEHRDDAGIQFSIKRGRIESSRIVH